ncbi:branched-chain amino acid ABC transporter permease [Paraburkholderia sp. NPDC080076]|jgi:branched-chain amino acid transport system permease protein|uniref:branched-chain amino acid ABC transporter permease n=1 Tax=Paraburkholderia sp. NPDC080076 TaxID=3390605 RepID=UPI003D07A889
MRNLHIRWWTVGTALAVAATFLVKGPYAVSVINLIAISALIAASLRFGMLIGEVSFATSSFVGLGAYGAGVATTLLNWPFPLAMLLGPVVVIGISILFGLVTLRVKGPYFMLIGFAFVEVVRITLGKIAVIGGVAGMGGIYPPRILDPWMPTLVMAVVIALLFSLYVIEKSDFGKVLVAIRDNEDIARTVGLRVLSLKIICFAIASFCAGVAGSLHGFVNNVISPGDFGFLVTVFALAFVKVGGESSIFGAILGAVILVVINTFALGLGDAEHYVYGGAIVLAMLLMPQGLVGLPWHKCFKGRRAKPPAHVSKTVTR